MNSWDVLDYLPGAQEKRLEEERVKAERLRIESQLARDRIFDAINRNHENAMRPAPEPVKAGIVARIRRAYASQ